MSNQNTRNIENLLLNYLLNSIDTSYPNVGTTSATRSSQNVGSPHSNANENGTNNTENSRNNAMSDRNINLLIRVFDAYQRNVEMYHRNMGELIQLLRTNMNAPSRQTPVQAPAPAPVEQAEPATRRESRYRPWYFSTATTRQPVDTSNNTTETIQTHATSSAAASVPEPEPVPASRLNNREIDSNVSTITYSSDETETQCPISLEDFCVGESICKINNCGHIFKRDALYRWFNNHNTCPVCRCNVLPSNRNTRYNIRNSPLIENNIINDYAQSIAYGLLAGLNTNPSNIYSYTLDIPLYYDMSGGNASENRSSQNVGSPHIFRSNANENGRTNNNTSNYDYIFANDEPEE
jgi:hypothetical protein